MSYVIVRHRVADYGRWRPVYDADAPVRQAVGLMERGIFREAAHPNDLWLLFEVLDEDRARQFMNSDDLREKMNAGGVIGEPEIVFLEEAERVLV